MIFSTNVPFYSFPPKSHSFENWTLSLLVLLSPSATKCYLESFFCGPLSWNWPEASVWNYFWIRQINLVSIISKCTSKTSRVSWWIFRLSWVLPRNRIHFKLRELHRLRSPITTRTEEFWEESKYLWLRPWQRSSGRRYFSMWLMIIDPTFQMHNQHRNL